MATFEELIHLARSAPLDALIAAAAGHDLSRRDAGGRTLLHHAAGATNEAACRWLLAQGVDVDARDDRGRTAADYVSCGDPSCDPEDVSAWRALRAALEDPARERAGTTG